MALLPIFPPHPQSCEGYSSYTVIDFGGSDALPLLSYQEKERRALQQSKTNLAAIPAPSKVTSFFLSAARKSQHQQRDKERTSVQRWRHISLFFFFKKHVCCCAIMPGCVLNGPCLPSTVQGCDAVKKKPLQFHIFIILSDSYSDC